MDTKDKSKDGGRSPNLNVIYFVDSAKTRSFKIPVPRLHLILVSLCLVLFWGIGSIFIIVWLNEERQRVEERLEASLATIFEYESRYDHVYEIAYPPEDAVPGMSLAKQKAAGRENGSEDEEQSNDKVESENPNRPDTSSMPTINSLEDEKISVQAYSKKEAAEKQGVEPIEIKIGNPIVEPGKDSLELRFDLENKISPEKLSGYVWAVAKFYPEKGEPIFIGAPAGIQVQDGGDPTYPERSNRFAIRYFKRKKLSFPYVAETKGAFTNITIGVMNRSGTKKNLYRVPVEIRVDTPPSSGAKSGALGGFDGVSHWALAIPQ